MTRLFTPDGAEIVAFTGGQWAVVRRGTRLHVESIHDLEVVDPDELDHIMAEHKAFNRTRRSLTPYLGPEARTNAIGGPQTGRGVK